MAYVKVCPTCATINERNAIVCTHCSQVISSVKPTIEEEVRVPDPSETQKDNKKTALILRLETGVEIRIGQPGILGREGDHGRLELSSIDTVSRKHCRIEFSKEAVAVTDLGSTNGTFINGCRLLAQQVVPIKAGDILSLGPDVRMVVL